MYANCESYAAIFGQKGIKVKKDCRENYSPGWKFNHWELKGVPLRVEVGPKDVQHSRFVAVRRDTGDKLTINKHNCGEEVVKLLRRIQQELFNRANAELNAHLSVTETWEDFLRALEKSHLMMAPFCGDTKCEENIKDQSKSNTEGELDSTTCVRWPRLKCIKQNTQTQLCTSVTYCFIKQVLSTYGIHKFISIHSSFI